MSVEETRRVVEGYLAGLDSRWLAEGVELLDMGSFERWTGRNEVSDWLARNVAGAMATPRLSGRSLTLDEGTAAAEWEVRGRRVSWDEGHEPAMDDLALPMVAVFEVEADRITHVRMYFDAQRLDRERTVRDRGEPTT